MPKVKINGAEYEFPAGMKVLEACKQVGIHVPHFCYHPLLKVVGSCRMCKVEITQEMRGQKQSRIDISCRVDVADGMEVQTDTPGVRKQQQMTLEFLLANHPLDCPICDDAGECELQNYYMEFGRHPSRMREPKVIKRKATDIGRSIVLDSERCVLCSRCVRFVSDITQTNELGIFGMGSTEELMLKPNARLDNDYAGNVVDLCPVGALTDKDFRFKRRVWYLNHTPSICDGCARGCNVRIDWDTSDYHLHKSLFKMATHRTPATEYQRIQRIKPRTNLEVNGAWICDHGRYGYKPTDASDRLLHPLVSRDGELHEMSAADAISTLAEGLNSAIKTNANKVAIVVSPKLTNEEVFAVWSLFQKKIGLTNVDHCLPIPEEWKGDDLLKSADPYPNRTACEWIGVVPGKNGVGVDGLEEAILKGKIDTLLTCGCDPSEFLSDEALGKLKRRYVFVRNINEKCRQYVDIAIPAAAWGEYQGTFINFQSRIQKLEAAFEPLGEALPIWNWIIELSVAMKNSLRWSEKTDVLRSMSEQVKQLAGLDFNTIGSEGMLIGNKK